VSSQCSAARSSIRRDRTPCLFDRPTSVAGIAQSNESISLVEWVLKRIVDYAFHARSAVDWEKYKANHTDRTAGKAKKMGRRELLKGSGAKLEK
jgi:hypothetical protein